MYIEDEGIAEVGNLRHFKRERKMSGVFNMQHVASLPSKDDSVHSAEK